MDGSSPIIWWVRKDLRLSDNQALQCCLETGQPIIPVFILDEVFETYGACPLWRFGLGAKHFAETLGCIGSKLTFRRGNALQVLKDLAAETGATGIFWARAYDPDQVAREQNVTSALEEIGIPSKSVPGHLLFEPWDVKTKADGYYRVYSPFWRAVKDRQIDVPLRVPTGIPSPGNWPQSDDQAEWRLRDRMQRGAAIVANHVAIGEEAAQGRLDRFLSTSVGAYREQRDIPSQPATSGLSENLAWGEISPRVIWHSGMRALSEGKHGAEHFLKELVWREFAYHLVWHTPHIVKDNWRDGWNSFPWGEDPRTPEVRAWTQGRTGEPFVDAAMRELYTTGYMHNRARMIVASYLTKHLLTHWRIGQEWFADCLLDWDPASNAMGWQWAAGSGPDASPFFRIFNPTTQLKKFDPDNIYRDRWIAELANPKTQTSLDYFKAVPKSWQMQPDDEYPMPIVELAAGRHRALDAYRSRDF